jgi:hypothetical protein
MRRLLLSALSVMVLCALIIVLVVAISDHDSGSIGEATVMAQSCGPVVATPSSQATGPISVKYYNASCEVSEGSFIELGVLTGCMLNLRLRARVKLGLYTWVNA